MGQDTAATVVNNEVQGRFEATVEGHTAFTQYRLLDGDRMLMPHTIVPPELEGRGLGGAVVRTALAFARERRLSVIPACSFVAAYIQRHPEYADLVAR